jgi:preprotein translocase subunit YajC
VLGNVITLAAAPVAATAKSSSSGINVILIIVVLFAVLYFVMIRPQRNRQRKVAEQQRQVHPGQRVRTTAGMYATVVAVDGDDVILEVAPGVEVRYVKRAIMQVLPDEDPAHDEPSYAAEDETDAADDEAEGHDADAHEADVAEHAADEPFAHADETAPHADGESPNGAPATADESRTQGTV